MSTTAVIALSGGQDSGTALFHAVEIYDTVHSVSFDYGQRHAVELDCARDLADVAGVASHKTLKFQAFHQLGQAALTNPAIDVQERASNDTEGGVANTFAARHMLPSTFVPGRNIILLGLTAAYGVPRGATVLVTGVCAADRAGYPDCRAEFVTAMQMALQLGLDTPPLVIDAPMLWRTKAETWQLAADLGVTEHIVNRTHTCYEGDHEHVHAWGYGCGHCPACQGRAEGWYEWLHRGKRAPAHGDGQAAYGDGQEIGGDLSNTEFSMTLGGPRRPRTPFPHGGTVGAPGAETGYDRS